MPLFIYPVQDNMFKIHKVIDDKSNELFYNYNYEVDTIIVQRI